MKITSTILNDLIHEFNFKISEMGVCFDANIDFNLSKQKVYFQSEVLMQSFLSNSIDTIYLLNPITEIYNIPTFFSDINHQFIYLKGRGLFIADHDSLSGSYSIVIYPTSRDCTQKTFNEVKAKKLN